MEAMCRIIAMKQKGWKKIAESFRGTCMPLSKGLNDGPQQGEVDINMRISKELAYAGEASSVEKYFKCINKHLFI